jgi:hypothetical protein
MKILSREGRYDPPQRNKKMDPDNKFGGSMIVSFKKKLALVATHISEIFALLFCLYSELSLFLRCLFLDRNARMTSSGMSSLFLFILCPRSALWKTITMGLMTWQSPILAQVCTSAVEFSFIESQTLIEAGGTPPVALAFSIPYEGFKVAQVKIHCVLSFLMLIQQRKASIRHALYDGLAHFRAIFSLSVENTLSIITLISNRKSFRSLAQIELNLKDLVLFALCTDIRGSVFS